MDRRRPRHPPGRPLVLVAADDDDTRELCAVDLSALGFETITAAGCAQGGRRAWESHPDIVVAGLTSPDGDGWQLIRDLKGDARTRDIPVVLLTADNPPALRERAEREGFAALLVKPCPADVLAVELRQVLETATVHAQSPTSR